MEKSEHIDELITALSRAQGEFPPVPLNAANPFLHNHYADLGSVIETVKSILSNHELSVTQLARGDGAFVGVTTVLAHKSGQWIAETITLPLSDEKGKSLAQVAGSVITYLRRYAYTSILGLYAGDDDDGNDPVKPEPKKPAIQPKPQLPKPEVKQEPVKEPEKEKTVVPTITVWNGSQKPAQDLLSDKAAEAFLKAFVTDKVKNPGEHLFNSKAYLTNHLRSHFSVDALQEMTYEKVMACLAHMKGEGDDPRWYKETPAQLPLPEPQKQEVPVTGDPASDVDAELINAVSFKAFVASYADLSDDQKKQVKDALEVAKNIGFTSSNVDQIAELAKLK